MGEYKKKNLNDSKEAQRGLSGFFDRRSIRGGPRVGPGWSQFGGLGSVGVPATETVDADGNICTYFKVGNKI